MSAVVKQKLERLHTILDMRFTWQEKVQQVERMQSWIVTTEEILAGKHLLDGEVASGERIGSQLDAWIASCAAHLTQPNQLSDREQECLQEFVRISQSLRPRLTHCYDVVGLPRTNNAMEGYIRHLKTRYRRVSGRKSWNAYLLRYGHCVAYLEWFEGSEQAQGDLMRSLQHVDHRLWKQTRLEHRALQQDRLKVYRFRHKRNEFLQQLEARWGHSWLGT